MTAKIDREIKAEAVLKAFIVISALVILTVTSILAINYYLVKHDARNELYTAKMARLAAITVAQEKYGAGQAFSDEFTNDGFAEGVSSKIKTVGQYGGKLELITPSSDGYGIVVMTYTDGEYTVVYDDTTGNETWTVYRKQVLISP
jgi:hypothetical protein